MPDESIRLVHASGECEIDLARRELRVLGSPVPVGGRAFEIIEVLVGSAGEVVTKDELMDRIWPGSIVGENTLHVHAGAIRKALGPYRSLLKTESGRGYRLLGDWTAHRHHAATPPPGLQRVRVEAESPVTNFPATVTRLIGRTAAVARVRDLMSAYRVVTLTGPGGIGKTSLALKAARGVVGEFAGGGWLVELASLSDAALVPSTAAGVLKLPIGPAGVTSESVARSIGDKKLLLLLDNCEHLIGAVATLSETLLAHCPHTTIIATSRETLRIAGEQVYRVPPLEVPDPGQDDADHILGHTAVELFIARTRASDAGFSPCATELPSIAAICRHLDGIPLAIELAAARAAALGPREVLRRLGDRLALLTGGHRTALPRHRTLRAAIDWSYNLLGADEQKFLRAASVFAAGFTWEAGAAVAAMDSEDVINAIAGLGDKSLVYLETTGDPVRWRMLETTRAYALQALKEAGEYDATARRQAEYYAEYLSTAGDEFLQPTTEHVGAFLLDIDNVRGALDWAFSSPRDVVLGARLTGAAIPLWLGMSLLTECRDRIGRALNSLPPGSPLDPHVRLRLYAALGVSLLGTLAMREQTGSALNEMLAIAEALDDVDYLLQALWTLWSYYLNNGMNRDAELVARKLMEVARRGGAEQDFYVGERLLGTTMHYLGQQSDAQRHLENVLSHYTAPADHLRRFLFDQAVLARSMLARVQWMRGLTDQATRNARDATAAAIASGHVLSLCYALAEAGCPVPLATGDLKSAEDAITTMVEVATNHRLNFWRLLGHCMRGVLLLRRGMTVEGVAVLRNELNAYRMAGWTMRFAAFLGELAAGLASVGQIPEALASIEEALVRAERDGEMWCASDLTRIKGEIVLRAGGVEPVEAARTCFIAAITLARQQGALFWELRAASSLASLPGSAAETGEARDALAVVVGRFTEGFDTDDMVAARRRLLGDQAG